jgi:catechol-2,3-dioxygenase
MNTEVIVRPNLHHYGLTTANMDAMIEWYRKALGMTVNHRGAVPAGRQDHAPFSGMAFISNDEADHRIVFFEVPGLVVDPDKARHPRLQHVAFEYQTFDDLLGTYLRLKGLGIMPVWATDHGLGTAFYYEDPDQNIVEINVNNYGNAWTATEHMKTSSPTLAPVDPEKMVAARKAGASPWELHERTVTGEFAPAKPSGPHTRL